MKKFIILGLVLVCVVSCNEVSKDKKSDDTPKFIKGNKIDFSLNSYGVVGSSYLSVYSEIYSQTEHRTHSLTATVSIRNTNKTDTIILDTADYYSSKGKLIRSYLKEPIYLEPLETIDIVVSQEDREGGTGANFIFDWKTKENSSDPLFEGVMISTYGQQGLSFTTLGVKL